MIRRSLSHWQQPRKALYLAKLLLLCLVFLSWSLPVYAVTQSSIDSRLEGQILQIIHDHPEAILESIQAYQQQQKEQQQQKQQAFLQEMRANPQAIVGQSPTTGAAKQKIVLLEFSDFQCPYCAKAHQSLKQFVDTHQSEVTLVYKHLPLTRIHSEALPAAKAAWAALQQGKFWQYHDALFAQQEQLGETLYVATAKKLNLDLEQFNRDRNSDTALTAIEQDMVMAQKAGVQGTPFLAMNGEPFFGAVSLSEMEKVLARVST